MFRADRSTSANLLNMTRRRGRVFRSVALLFAITGLVLYPASLVFFPDAPKPVETPAEQDLTGTTAQPVPMVSLPEPPIRLMSHENPVPADNDSGVANAVFEQPPPADHAVAEIQKEVEAALGNQKPSVDTGDPAAIDELILSGNYSAVTSLLEESRIGATGVPRDKITLRLALCAELQSKPGKALDYYRSLMAGSHEHSVSDAAILSVARILISSGRRDVGNHLLMRLLLSREATMKADDRADLVHTLAAGLTYIPPGNSLLADDEWLLPQRKRTPEELLESWSHLNVSGLQDRLPESFNLEILTGSPQGILTTVQSENLTASEFLQRIAIEVGWLLHISEADMKILRQRRLDFAFRELPLDLVLDSLLDPVGFSWKAGENELTIQRRDIEPRLTDADMKIQSERDTAGRFLQLAVNLAPDHQSAPMSYLLLGANQAIAGKLNESRRLFEMCRDLYPRSSAAGPASFNLGKVCLQQGDRDDAMRHFYRTVDLVSGPDLDAVAYMFLGRILLENDAPREAMVPLMRGLSLTKGTRYEGSAVLLLAAAYLMDGNAEGANAILVDHRRSLQEKSNADDHAARRLTLDAAFLSSLVRHQGTRGPQRMREARSLLSTLTVVHPEESFGEHMDFLAGVAFGIVGLETEQNAVFQNSLAGSYEFPLQYRMRAVMSGRARAEAMLKPGAAVGRSGRVDDIGVSGTRKHEGLVFQAEAAWRSGRADDVIKFCRQFLTQTATDDSGPESEGNDDAKRLMEIRKTALRLMGLAYQSKGEHQKAVWCLTGVVPAADEAKPDESLPMQDEKL